MEGKITFFDPIKKYGFIAYSALDKSESVFCHIKGFDHFLTPDEQNGLVGKTVTFEMGVSPTGRPCAQNVAVKAEDKPVAIVDENDSAPEKGEEEEDDELMNSKELRRQGYATCKIRKEKAERDRRAPKYDKSDISVNPRDYEDGEE